MLLANSHGSFAPSVALDVTAKPTAVRIADLNSDGRLDLAVAGEAGALSLLRGRGNGTFLAARSYPLGKLSSSIGVGDFDGDGLPDLAVANPGDRTVSVLRATCP